MFKHSDLFIEMVLKSKDFKSTLQKEITVGDYLYVTSVKKVVLCLGVDKEGFYETKEVKRKSEKPLIDDILIHVHPKQEFYWLPTIGEMIEQLCDPTDYFTLDEILKSCFSPNYGIGLLESLYALFQLFGNEVVWNIPERKFVNRYEAEKEIYNDKVINNTK